jgi:hypothetical protein
MAIESHDTFATDRQEAVDFGRLNWSAIWSGVLLSLGFLILFLFIGTALGFSIRDPYKIAMRENSHAWPVATIIWVFLSGIIAAFLGSLLSGAFRAVDRYESIGRGAVIWALSTVLVTAFGLALLSRSSAPQSQQSLAYYSSLDDPQFANFILQRARSWTPGTPPEQPVNVSYDASQRVKPKDVTKNNDLKKFIQNNTSLSRQQTDEFLEREENAIAQQQAGAEQRWEQQHAIELSQADRARKTVSAASWTIAVTIFAALAASIGGSLLGWQWRSSGFKRTEPAAPMHHTDVTPVQS